MFDRSDARLRRKPILSNPLVTFRCVSEVTGAESANPPPPPTCRRGGEARKERTLVFKFGGGYKP